MFSKLTFAVLAALALSAAAKPVVRVDKSHIKLPVVRHLNLTGTSIVKSDQARAKYLKTRHLNEKTTLTASQAKSMANAVGVDVTNGAVTYTADITVGNPPQAFTLIVDTGSSNTWVGANTPFIPGPSSQDTGAEVIVEYGSGLFLGEEFIDTLTVGDITIPQQSFGAAEFAFGFNGVDGILGLGPVDLTDDTTSAGGEIPTVTDNAFSLGLIENKVLGIAFEPTNSLSDTNGELTFGGIDSSKWTGEITFTPITSTLPAGDYVGIDQTVAFAGQTILQSSGITDTGTTLLLLASDAFDAYTAATGAVLDENTGLLSITQDQFDNLQSLFFTIGGTTFEFTKNAQLWPRVLNTAIGGTDDQLLLVVSDLGSPSGEGLDFINGMTFLERFFTVFDAANAQFGIATSPFTNSTSN